MERRELPGNLSTLPSTVDVSYLSLMKESLEALGQAMAQRCSRESLLSFLQEHGVESESYDHPVVMTVEEQAKHIGHLEGGFSKNLFLKDKKNRLYLVSALPATNVDMKALSVRLGLGKGGVRMAPEESLQAILQVPLGSVTPFALINKSAGAVSLILDKGFQSKSRVFFHPLSNDASTALTPGNLDKFLHAIGREPAYVDLEAAVVVGKDQPPDLAYLVPKEAEVNEMTSTGAQETFNHSVAPPLTKGLAVTPLSKQSTPTSTKAKQKPAVPKENTLRRVDLGSVLTTILDSAVAAAVTEVNTLGLDDQNKQAVAQKVDAAIRLRLSPELESLLMLFKNTMYTEGFKSAIDSQRLSVPRHQ